MKLSLTLFCTLAIAGMGFFGRPAWAQVVVYPAPGLNAPDAPLQPSPLFRVQVKQGSKTYESFVYSSRTNFENPDQQSDVNHWTTFESKGPVEVLVTRLDGDMPATRIYPARHQLVPTVQQNQLRFTLDKPAKLLLDMAGLDEQPLFIFADSPETDKPARTDKNVIWFEAGKLHNVGLQYRIPAGKTVYIEGGAVVWGTFWCEDGNQKTTIRGRGILTTRSAERKPGPTNIPFSTIYSPKTDMAVSGITITDPVHFCIIGRGRVETSNVKLFAWYHQTDGWGGGDSSWIDDSFMKVFDDNVKLYGVNQKATNLVLYQQHNGAPFQLSWGSQSGQHCLADTIDIVKCWVNKKGGPGNSAVLNLRKGSDRPISDITIRNLRADQGIYQLIGFGNDKGGTVKNITLENVTIHGKQSQSSYLFNSANSQTQGINLKHITLNGTCFAPADVLLNGVDPQHLTITCP